MRPGTDPPELAATAVDASPPVTPSPRSSTVGANHPFAGDALLGIGECKLAKGDVTAANTALERSLAIRKEGSRGIELADVEFPLARVRWAQHRRDEALELAQSARKAYASEPTGKRGLDELDRWLATTGAK